MEKYYPKNSTILGP